MSKLNEKQRLILTIAVSAVLVGGLVALILKDRGEIEDVQTEIQTIEAQIGACDVEIKRTAEREEQVLVFRAVEDAELAILPTQQKIADFLRNLSTFFASSGVEFQRAPESSPKESELAKGIFETRTRLTLAGDARSVLDFMNMVENDPRLVAVKGFRVSAGQLGRVRAPDEDQQLKHDIDMTLSTYFYNPAAGDIERVHIPNEQKRLQEERIQGAIEAFQPERPDRYVLSPSASRRDPFVDPRKKRVVQDPEEYARLYKSELEIVEEIQSQFDVISENIEKEKALIQAGDLFRADRLGQEIDGEINEVRAQLQHVTELKRVSIPELQARVQLLGTDLETVMARRPQREVTVTRSIAERTLIGLQDLFRNGKYIELATEVGAWDAYIRGKDVDPEALPVMSDIKLLKKKAKDLSDFNSLRLTVRGTIIDKLDPDRSIVMINGRTYRSGDRLDESGEVVVGVIQKDAVSFQFREQEVIVLVGASSGRTEARGVVMSVTQPR